MALTDNLISCWELEEASGTRVDAVVASANDLTDNNTVTQQTGKVGNCGQFTKANSEYLSRADNASLSCDGETFTVCAWVYQDAAPAANTANNIASKLGGFANWEWRLMNEDIDLDGGRFQFNIWADDGTQDTVYVTGTPSNATWYFVMAALNTSSDLLKISVNDGTVFTAAQTKTIVATNAAFQIGAANSLAFWGGRIDQVCFWKRDVFLVSADVTAMYNGGAGLSYAAMQPPPSATSGNLLLLGTG